MYQNRAVSLHSLTVHTTIVMHCVFNTDHVYTIECLYLEFHGENCIGDNLDVSIQGFKKG